VTAERRLLRPVTLSPEEAALAWIALMSINVPATRTKDHVSACAKLEAACEPEAPAPTEDDGA
jgi:hypothetical protein